MAQITPITLSSDADIRVVNDNFNAINDELTNVTTVTIPISGWTTQTDANSKTYYTIDINVTGITSSFIGLSDTDYVRPTPYSVDMLDIIKEMFALITDIVSNNGYITVYASEIPTTSFQIYLYGV